MASRRHAPTKRAVSLAIGALVAAVLVLCAIGLRLTILQRGDVRGFLLDLERKAAEAQCESLDGSLRARERQILETVDGAWGDAGAVASVVKKNGLTGAEPFAFTESGDVEMPFVGRLPRRSPMLSDEPQPPEFASALRVAWSDAAVEDKLQALETIRESEGMAPQWRYRALTALASVELQAGAPNRALDIFTTIFEESAPHQQPTAPPSYLQMVLARAECALAAGRAGLAGPWISSAIDRIEQATVEATLSEQEFFVRRVTRLAGAGEGRGTAGAPRLSGLPLDRVDRVAAILRHRQASRATAQTLRDWLSALGRIDRESPASPGPRLFFDTDMAGTGERKDLLMPAVWMRLPAAGTDAGRTVVGLVVKLEDIETLARSCLDASATKGRFVVQTEASRLDADFLPLAALRGDHRFLHIGLTLGTWRARLGRAQRPFDLAAVLIVLLAVLLVFGLLFLMRGVRRETALAHMKTQFVANVSHELKTPLALIRLFGETLLLDRVADPAQRKKYYEIIARESERLAHLIANVLSFSSIEAGKKRYELQPCDVGLLVQETYESYRFHLDAKKFRHSIEVAGGLPRVRVDREAIAQAVINLLENAVKYSRERKEIHVSVKASAGAVRISIRDAGVGIAAEDQTRVWEDYYRTREARALATRGSGLGLSLVRHILRAHGGRVEIESAVGEGSTFTLVLPAARSSPGGNDAVDPAPQDSEAIHEDENHDTRH